jgi:hypothetical protein
MAEGKAYFQPLPPFIDGGEREGLDRSLGSTTHAGIELESATGGTRQSPLLWVANVWAVVSI